MPLARVRKICDVLEPVLVITDQKHVHELEGLEVDILLIDEINYEDVDENLLLKNSKGTLAQMLYMFYLHLVQLEILRV